MNKKKKVLIAFDKFKETITSEDLALITTENLRKEYGETRVEVSSVALSDGGDGFLSSLTKPLNLEIVTQQVTGPLGTPVQSRYGVNEKRGIAVIEMALASGLALVPEQLRNPLHTTTKGTGDLLIAAYEKGYRKIILGVGGSATNDAGLGCIHRLGLDITLKNGTSLGEYVCGKDLKDIEAIQIPKGGLLPGANIEISCDVTTLLYGQKGATLVFGAQKGIKTKEQQDALEEGIKHVSGLFPYDVSSTQGSGAAGGLPGGLLGVLGPQRVVLKPGFDIISDAWNLKGRIAQDVNLVITGEGSFDSQTTEAGKVVFRVLQLCEKYKVPVVVLCGKSDAAITRDLLTSSGVHVYDMVSRYGVEDSMKQAHRCFDLLIKETIHSWPILTELIQ